MAPVIIPGTAALLRIAQLAVLSLTFNRSYSGWLVASTPAWRWMGSREGLFGRCACRVSGAHVFVLEEDIAAGVDAALLLSPCLYVQGQTYVDKGQEGQGESSRRYLTFSSGGMGRKRIFPRKTAIRHGMKPQATRIEPVALWTTRTTISPALTPADATSAEYFL